MSMKPWKCPVCGKVFDDMNIWDFATLPKTILFGNFEIKYLNDEVVTIDRKINIPVCSTECKQNNENRYFVEEYKGNKIYCVEGKYMPYLECEYWFESLEDVKKRIDEPHLRPVTPSFVLGFYDAISGK